MALQAAQHDNLALRLSLLQGQLEPQFLLCSLDGIGEMVRDAERPQAIRALARLSDLLRYALRSGQQDWLSVADEIGFMRDYLDLQVLRFGARLQVQWTVADSNWSLYSCPALLLHQLIEQTIEEGMQGEVANFTLALAFSLQAGKVRIVVKHAQGQARTVNGNSTPSSTYLAVRERLQILYGSAATLETEIADGESCVIFSFPALGRADD